MQAQVHATSDPERRRGAGSSEKLATILQEVVIKRVESDTLLVPSMPAVATHCLALLRAEDVDLREVTKLVQRDPVIAARLLRIASSAAVAAGGAPTIQQAVTRLGASAMRRLILDASVCQLFQSRDPRIAATVGALWNHSLAVALAARDVAAIVGNTDPEGAYLAGLLHDVGKPIAAAILLELERMSDPGSFKLDATGWLEAVQGVHRTIGVVLAEKWRLPEGVAAAIRDSSEYDVHDRGALANIVCLANGIAKAEGLCPAGVDESEARATVVIGRSLFGLDEETVSRLAQGLGARVAAEGA